MAEQPNDASRKSKAEGDRPADGEQAGAGSDFQSTDERTASGKLKCGPPDALTADSDSDLDPDDSRRSER
jgi:hypothetical protein